MAALSHRMLRRALDAGARWSPAALSRRCFSPLLLLLSAAGLAAQPSIPTISVDVNTVILHVTVRDRQGGFVSGLTRQDFHVFDNGAPQPIQLFEHEDVPVAVGLVVDSSGSMSGKRKDVAAAARAFVLASNPRDQMFVINFNEHVRNGLPEGEWFSRSPAELEEALNRATPSGETALYDAILAGLSHLARSNLENKVLIVISDGGDNASRHRLRQVLEAARRSSAVIYTIGLFDPDDDDRNPGVLQKIARASGGEAYLPPNPADVVPVCRRIAADIPEQYTIGYRAPAAGLDHPYHTIRVTASGPHGNRLLVRTREGYLAPDGAAREMRP